MKAARFRYHAAASVEETASLLASGAQDCAGGSVLLAGGQSLVPALSLRRRQPAQVIDIMRIAELSEAAIAGGSLVLGACLTAQMIEDGLVPDVTRGILCRIAARAGPRAVRCRGTLGGNLALADPVSDWITSLSALGAVVATRSARGSRSLSVSEIGRLGTGAIAADELVLSVSVPEVGPGSAWGAWALRPTAGARPEIAAAIFEDPRAGAFRCAIAIAGSAFLLLEQGDPPRALLAAIGSGVPPPLDATLALLAPSGGDGEAIRLMAAAVGRAAAEAIRV